MALSNKKIAQVVVILRGAVRQLKEPSVTLVGKKWKSPFLVLVSCLLSLRTKDGVTLASSNKLFEVAMTPEEMVRLTEEKIAKTIYPVGFYRTKAKNIKAISRILIDQYSSEVPNDMDLLLSLPGVGRKTANLVLTEGFGELGICVDTHVHRISNRLGYVETKSPEETEMALRKKLPEEFWIEYNMLLVTWGQNVCRPISPVCSQCGLDKLCARVGVEKSR